MMTNRLRLTTAALAPTLALALLLPSAASASNQEAEATSCYLAAPAETPAEPLKKKNGFGLGGLLGAAKQLVSATCSVTVCLATARRPKLPA